MKLTESMRTWSVAERRWHWGVALAVVSGVAVGVAYALGAPFEVADSRHYLDMAEGRPAMLPFASRVLGPLLARGLSSALHLSAEQAFLVLALACLLIFAGATLWLVTGSGSPRWILAAIAGMSFWTMLAHSPALPDLLHGTLLACMLLLLRRQPAVAATLFFPLAMARESTVLMLLCLLFAGWKLTPWRNLWLATGCTAGGLIAAYVFTPGALPNQEHISPALYFLAKMPWNLLKNFAGVSPWANVYPACSVPIWHHNLHLGTLQEIGSCGFDWHLPVRLMGSALASFGLLPLLLWKSPWTVPRGVDAGERLVVRFCLVYGIVSFAIAGLLGDLLLRLFGYAWPVFFVALPTLIASKTASFPSARRTAAWVLVHLSLNWGALFIGGVWLLMLGLAGYALGWWLMRVRPGMAGATGR